MIKEAIFQKLWSDSQNHQREVVGVGESGACENLRIIRGRWWEWERVEHVRASGSSEGGGGSGREWSM